MTMRAIAVVSPAVCLVALGACATSDIGDDCPQLLGATNPVTVSPDGRSETAEVVGYDPLFPCDSLTCVASQGKSGYCSKGCRDSSVCPSAFDCRVITPVGDFAGQEFCAWKSCTRTADCGSTTTYCCRPVPGSDPVSPLKLCDFAHGDHCE
jgi:hypothetical protein